METMQNKKSNWDPIMGWLSEEASVEQLLQEIDPVRFEIESANGHETSREIKL